MALIYKKLRCLWVSPQEDINLQDDKLYKGEKLIKNHNWHHILCDIGWYKMNIQWIKKLNKLGDNKGKNSLYGVLDCGGDGDCFLNNEVNNWWSKNDIIGPWPGMAQSLMVAYNGKRLINLYFKTKVKTIENVKENERKEVDELKLKNRLKITKLNTQKV